MTEYVRRNGYPINIIKESQIIFNISKDNNIGKEVDKKSKEIKEEKTESKKESHKEINVEANNVSIEKEKTTNQKKDLVIEIIESLKSIYLNYSKK